MPTTTLQIRAVPNGRRAEVIGRYGDAWKIRVAAAPEKGRANDELTDLLASVLGVSRTAVTVLRGHTSRDKLVRIDGVSAAQATAALENATTARRSY